MKNNEWLDPKSDAYRKKWNSPEYQEKRKKLKILGGTIIEMLKDPQLHLDLN